MKQLINPNLTPPGGWRFTDPDTGYEFDKNYRSLHELLLRIKKYRSQNKLDPIPELRYVVETQICNKPGLDGRCRPYHPKRSVAQYYRGGKALVETVARRITGRKAFVSSDVANKRAATCVRCEENLANPEHSYTDEFAARTVGARKTPDDDKLFSCGICTCPLRPKVHLLQSVVESDLTPSELALLPSGAPGLDGEPLYCWQKFPIPEES